MLALRRLLICTLLSLLCIACAPTTTKRENLAPLDVQAKVDLEKFMGRWYVIANIPYRAEAGKVGGYVEYRPRPDGRMDDLYFFRKKDFDSPLKQWSGVAWVVDKNTNARWLAQFIWPFSFDYLILETAPDYSWALVGHPSRDLAWVFAREEISSCVASWQRWAMTSRAYCECRNNRKTWASLGFNSTPP